VSLVIRAVAEGKVAMLRSVGGPPNGIVVVIHPGDDGEASWAIDPKYAPPSQIQVPGKSGVVIDTQRNPGGKSESAIDLSVDDLVAGVADSETALVVWQMVVFTVAQSVEQFAGAGVFEQVIADARFAIETRDALAAAGYLGRAQA
jgi:hypothetical protein